MKKRRIALFIILSVLLSTVVTTAAEPMTDIENNPHRNAIEQMAELGVLSGRGDGLFYPDDNLTRAEAAKVAVFLAGFDEQDAAQAKALPQAFDDVYAGMGHHEWALGWVNLAAREGIIAGYDDGKYGPGDTLNMVQWAAILIRILGYDSGGLEWPTDYDQLANELGLTEGLEYVSDSYIRRDQMAEFTVNALYKERPDGSKIIELLEDKVEEEPRDTEDRSEEKIPGEEMPEDTKEQELESISMDVVLTPEVLPEGGGQTAAIAVTITDKAGKPVEGAKVVFFASCFEFGNRNAQLSQSETTTDASGKARVTYTSLAADDKKMVGISVSAYKDPAVKQEDYEIMAANQAAVVCGVVRDPYTGVPVEGAHVNIMVSDTQEATTWAETDEQGRYRVVVPTASYSVSFSIARWDPIRLNANSPGQIYTVDYDRGVLKGVMTGVSPGTTVMAFDWSTFVRDNPETWTAGAETQSDGSFTLFIPPGTYELYIVGSPNPSKTGITVKSGQVTDIGTVKARW